MAVIPWSFVCDDGSSAQGAVSAITFNLLTLTIDGMLVDPESEGIELTDEAARRHYPEFKGTQVRIELSVDIVTSRASVKSIDLSTRFSEAEEERLRQALTRAFVGEGPLQDVIDRLSEG